MCGIAGFFGQGDQAGLERMTRSLAHRGPDDAGHLILPGVGDARIGLGHRRLAIIDLSERGRQPMTTPDGRFSLVFNGEIYNYRDLKRELQQAGVSFVSETDSEVLLQLFAQHGIEALQRLNGMFAFAIWDAEERRLVLARDHLGIKPLYYSLTGDTLLFGSEIKSILTDPRVDRAQDDQAIWDYLTYLYIPHPATAYRQIRVLPPASVASVGPDLRVNITRYWNPFESVPPAAGRLREIVEQATAMQMISDVPLGLFLSGGTDSNVLAGLMAQHAAPRKIKTFTVVHSGSDLAFFNETDAVNRVVERYQTSHHQLAVSLDQPDELFELGRAFDQPFANPTYYIAALLSRLARPLITVGLSGAGGDELFGGYPRYRYLNWARRLARLPGFCKMLLRGLVWPIPEGHARPFARRLRSFATGLGTDWVDTYARWTYYFDEQEKRELLPDHAEQCVPSRSVLDRHLAEVPAGTPLINRVEYLDLKTYLADNILTYSDITSMLASLELRVPLLDYRLVELSLTLTRAQKLKGRSKRAFVDACADLIPPQNLRGPKRGFCPPLGRWMTKLDSLFDERFQSVRIDRGGPLNGRMIDRLRSEHRSGRRDHSMKLFGLMVLADWWQTQGAAGDH